MSTRLLRILAMATTMIIVAAGTANRAEASAGRTPSFVPAAAAAAPGVVSGRITDGDDPIPGVTAELVLLTFPLVLVRAVSDADGGFRLEPAPVGDYRLRFTFPGGLVQYYPHETDPERATIVNIIDGDQLVLDDTVVPHGSLAGSITTDGGEPAPAAIVGLVRPDGSQFSTLLTNRDGSFVFAYLPAGTFSAFIGAAETAAPRQWAHRHKTRAEADPVVVAIGQQTTLDERLLPLGTITGQFTGVDGQVSVFAHSTTSFADSISVLARADGRFALTVYPGQYTVEFRPPSGLEQWAHGKELESQADVITVGAGATVVLDEPALPAAVIRGRLTDADGQPVPGAFVDISDAARGHSYAAVTDSDGVWFQNVRPGTYRVQFSTETQYQWAVGRSSAATATPIEVPAGLTTTVDDSFARPGKVSVTATDERTGASIASFCAEAEDVFLIVQRCTDTGAVEFPLGAGTFRVTVDDGDHVVSTVTGVRIAGGQTTRVAARLRPSATIAVTVTDARTGTPILNACVNAFPTDRTSQPNEFVGGCADGDGAVLLTRVTPGRYALTATPFDGVHGAQWVGPTGGVGAEADARTINARPGSTSTVAVKLDGRGNLAGTITDRSTGAPVAGALVRLWGNMTTTTMADGRYLMPDLGPYKWTVFFGHDNYAGQWTGGVSNRLDAEPVKVRADQTTTYEVKLRKGTTVSGRVAGTHGQLPTSGTVTVVNARTFDPMATATIGPDGVYTAHVLGPQDVRLLVEVLLDERFTFSWYAGAADFDHGRTVSVPPNGTTTVNVTVPPVGAALSGSS
jgi:protocatechuate 3,4-dioxygenase beta subunit